MAKNSKEKIMSNKLTKEQILEAAKQAKLLVDTARGDSWDFADEPKLTKFAELILSAQSPAPSEVKDWVMVPREPTQEMLNNAWDNSPDIENHIAPDPYYAYKAMLSAAPSQPEQADRVAELVKALEFYANMGTYAVDLFNGIVSPVERDLGYLARLVLAKYKKEGV